MRLSTLYIVDEGLKPKEKILFEGVENARDGLKISPEVVPFAYTLDLGEKHSQKVKTP